VDFAFKTYVLQDKHAVKDGCDAAKDAAEDGSEEEKEQAEQAKEACPDFD
jgi:hypothetical protein